MDELQLEEQQKTTQQSQDQAPYDPTAASRFPGGYTPVGEVVDNTPIEQVSPINVGEIEATASIDLSSPALESLGSSGDYFVPSNITLEEAYNAFGIPITPVNTNGINLSSINLPTFSGDNVGDISIPSNPDQQSPPVDEQPITPDPPADPPVPPVDPPVDPPVPPVDPPEPPVDPPVDPPEPPVDPPVDPPEPPVDPPVDPEEPEDPDPEDPEEPEDPDPEDPEEPEPDGGGNPGNDKDVGNSPWDGETGASDNPGKGNHQDGQDPEPNQPPGDSKNDGPNGNQNPPSENDNGNGGGGGKPESQGNNGWGNGDQDAPGNSLIHNNAENDQTPSGHTSDLVDKFLKDHPSDKHSDITYNWKQDTDDYLDYVDEYPVEFMDHVEIPDMPDVSFDEFSYE